MSRETIPLRYELRDLYQANDDPGKAVNVMAEALEILNLCGAERSVHDVEQWLRTVDQPNLTRFALQRHLSCRRARGRHRQRTSRNHQRGEV